MSTLLKEDWARPSKPQALRLVKKHDGAKSKVKAPCLDDIMR